MARDRDGIGRNPSEDQRLQEQQNSLEVSYRRSAIAIEVKSLPGS